MGMFCITSSNTPPYKDEHKWFVRQDELSELRDEGLVHTSHFCRVEFNSIKCGRNAAVDSDVALVSHLIQS